MKQSSPSSTSGTCVHRQKSPQLSPPSSWSSRLHASPVLPVWLPSCQPPSPSMSPSSCQSTSPKWPPFLSAQFSQYDSLLVSPVLPVWPPAPCYTGDCFLLWSPLTTGLQEGRCPQAPQVECRPPPPLLQMLQRFWTWISRAPGDNTVLHWQKPWAGPGRYNRSWGGGGPQPVPEWYVHKSATLTEASVILQHPQPFMLARVGSIPAIGTPSCVLLSPPHCPSLSWRPLTSTPTLPLTFLGAPHKHPRSAPHFPVGPSQAPLLCPSLSCRPLTSTPTLLTFLQAPQKHPPQQITCMRSRSPWGPDLRHYPQHTGLDSGVRPRHPPLLTGTIVHTHTHLWSFFGLSFMKVRSCSPLQTLSCCNHPPIGEPWGDSGWESTGHWPQRAECTSQEWFMGPRLLHLHTQRSPTFIN